MKVPAARTPESEGEGDWVSAAVSLIREISGACIPGTSREEFAEGRGLQCRHAWKRRLICECMGGREEKAGGEGPEEGLETAEPMTQTAG